MQFLIPEKTPPDTVELFCNFLQKHIEAVEYAHVVMKELTISVAYRSIHLGHCDVMSISTPLYFVSFFTGSVRALMSMALKWVSSDTISDSVPLRYANCNPELPE